MAGQQQERIVFVDYIRVVACFMVMLVHASENFYAADSSGLAGNVSMLANEANRFWVAFYDGGVGRTCVPLFMVVSAFLLVPLKPGVGMAQFYRRRFVRILPPFIIFTNATLRDMAVKRPRTRREMLRVDGVGEGKMDRYGDMFLRVIREYLEE